MDLKRLKAEIAAQKDSMVQDMTEMSRIPAINPRMGGQGEYDRMQWIIAYLKQAGLEYEVYEVPDDAVKEGVRLNVIATIPGAKNTRKSLWFISHVDTVGKGDLNAWNTDPLDPVIKEGRIYGLGCEDNSQSVITTLHLAALLQKEGLQAGCNLKFYYAADEETGSVYGMHAMLDKNIFGPDDEAIVPDGGSPDGSFIEIAEKSQVWLKFTVNGRTAHAAMPHLGINAAYHGMRFGVCLEDSLKKQYGKEDPLFNPPESTFELTQKFANVASPNVLPGKDEFCMDCRILPDFPVDEVMSFIDEKISDYEEANPGITITYEFVTRTDAPAPTPPESPVVQRLKDAISETGTKGYFGGIGGGTCGAILRKRNIPAVVWATLDETCHQPNEYVMIDNMVRDTQIYLSVIDKYTS